MSSALLNSTTNPYEYQRLDTLWKKVKDVYDGLYLEDVRQLYLPKRSSEPQDAYNVRLKASRLENRFRSSIDSYAGLLSDFEIHDAPDGFEDEMTDIDQRGNNFQMWSVRADIKMLRDGQCLIGVEMPPALTEEDQREERSPYLLAIDIADVLNPVTRVVGGRVILEEITIKRNYGLAPAGQSSSECWRYVANDKEHEYPTRVEIYCEREAAATATTGKMGFYLHDVYPILNASGEPLGRIPFIWYSATPDSEPMRPDYPPFLSLCDLNIAHMNKESELDDVETTSNRPTPTRTWPDKVPPNAPPVQLGQNGCIELPNGATMAFLEVEGKAMELTHRRQLAREERMDKEDQKFLGGGQGAKTATQVVLETAQSRTSFKLLARRKQSVIEELFKLWQSFSDPNYVMGDPAGYISISESALVAPPSPQDIQQVFQGFSQGVYSSIVAEHKLRELGWWPKELAEEPIQPETIEDTLEDDFEDDISNGRQDEAMAGANAGTSGAGARQSTLTVDDSRGRARQ
jgi:hypothetical protein